MNRDQALAIYHAGPEVVVKTIFGFCDTIDAFRNQIFTLENKIAKLSKNSSNSSKRPSSDDITKPPKKEKKKGKEKRKIGGQPGHEMHERKPFNEDEIDKTHPYILTECPECNGETHILDAPPRVIQQVELIKAPIIKEEHRSYRTASNNGWDVLTG